MERQGGRLGGLRTCLVLWAAKRRVVSVDQNAGVTEEKILEEQTGIQRMFGMTPVL